MLTVLSILYSVMPRADKYMKERVLIVHFDQGVVGGVRGYKY